MVAWTCRLLLGPEAPVGSRRKRVVLTMHPFPQPHGKQRTKRQAKRNAGFGPGLHQAGAVDGDETRRLPAGHVP